MAGFYARLREARKDSPELQEDATPSLGYSEMLSVKNPVGDPIPEFNQHSEEGSKRASVVDRQDAGDVLPHQP